MVSTHLRSYYLPCVEVDDTGYIPPLALELEKANIACPDLVRSCCDEVLDEICIGVVLCRGGTPVFTHFSARWFDTEFSHYAPDTLLVDVQVQAQAHVSISWVCLPSLLNLLPELLIFCIHLRDAMQVVMANTKCLSHHCFA